MHCALTRYERTAKPKDLVVQSGYVQPAARHYGQWRLPTPAPTFGGRVIPASVVATGRGQPRAARFTADTTARSDAVVIDVAIPTPHTVLPAIEASTYAAACASSPEDMACSE
jgi:hypothetical protein